MIDIKIDVTGFVFYSKYNGQILPFNEWANTDDCIYYFPLSTLVDNGNAMVIDNKCLVPFESIYFLDDSEQKILGIPSKYGNMIRLSGKGILKEPDFTYNIELLSFYPDGEILPFNRKGNVVNIYDKDYLLSFEQWQLFEEVERFNAVTAEEKTFENNLRAFAVIKELAMKSECELDSYLANENVCMPEQIQLRIERDGNDFTVLPSVNTEFGAKFTSSFERSRRVMDAYPIQNEQGERTRIVLSPKQKEGLELLKSHKCRYSSGSEIQDFVKNVSAHFDPEQFDLSEFYSDRVIEIGVYKPKFYPFVCPYESEWIVGATVETPENGTTHFTINTEEDLEDLLQAIDESEEEDSDMVEFFDTEFNIEDARNLAEMARKQLDEPHKPVKETEKKRVLIIEENAEELGYDPQKQEITRDNQYTLFSNPRLCNTITLKEHQKEGIAWLQYMYSKNAHGCLMADDMGLGKTLQILYFIDWHSQTYPNHKPYLIVAPVTLLENWEREFKHFFPESDLNITKLTAGMIPRLFDRKTIEYIQSLDIVLTSYETLRTAQLNFCAVEFCVIVLDEAQKIKSPGTMVTNAAKALKGKFKIAMTGTPVENTLVDLWCIMDFCVPGLLGNAKAFASQYQTPLKNEDTDIEELGNELHERLGIYLMRRMKTDVAKDMPVKHEIKKHIAMPAVQAYSYQNIIENHLLGVQPDMLETIRDMRSISEHPYLKDGTLLEHSFSEWINESTIKSGF